MLAKGIGAPTLALILSYLQDAQDYQTANQIANGTGWPIPPRTATCNTYWGRAA